MTDALRKKLARIAAACCDPGTTDALDKMIAGLDQPRAALAAPAVPPGWQLVPVEPTEAMLEAGLKRKALALWKDGASPLRASTANLRPVQEVAALQWAAMLAAAPTAQQEPKP